jgi:hypothetical protein
MDRLNREAGTNLSRPLVVADPAVGAALMMLVDVLAEIADESCAANHESVAVQVTEREDAIGEQRQ